MIWESEFKRGGQVPHKLKDMYKPMHVYVSPEAVEDIKRWSTDEITEDVLQEFNHFMDEQRRNEPDFDLGI